MQPPSEHVIDKSIDRKPNHDTPLADPNRMKLMYVHCALYRLSAYLKEKTVFGLLVHGVFIIYWLESLLNEQLVNWNWCCDCCVLLG